MASPKTHELPFKRGEKVRLVGGGMSGIGTVVALAYELGNGARFWEVAYNRTDIIVLERYMEKYNG